MTQHQHIVKYVLTFRAISPSHVANEWWDGKKFGSECPKRCRELRTRGILINPIEDGKLNDEKFVLNPNLPQSFNLLNDYSKI